MDNLTAFGVALAFAYIAESMTEYVFDLWVPEKYMKYASMATGILLAVVWRINFPSLLGVTAMLPFAGEVLTGFLLGRGANWLHDFGKKYLGVQ